MAFFFGDGFDTYSVITDCGTYWDAAFGGTPSLALSSTGRFAGSRAITWGSTSNTPYITKTSGSNDAVHHLCLAISYGSLSGSLYGIFFTLYDGATAQCTIAFRNDGAIILTAGLLGAVLATYTGAVAAPGTWYQFEIEVVINNTTGSIAVRRNGNTSNDFSLGSLNTRASANNYANKIAAGHSGSANAQTADDFLWRSDTASVAWIGDVRCFTRMPAADSAATWSKSSATMPMFPYPGATAILTPGTSGKYTPFIASCSGTVSSGIMVMNAGYTGNLKVSIFASSGSVPTTVLGSANVVVNPVIGNNTLTFGTAITVVAGTQYWFGTITDTSVGGSWLCANPPNLGYTVSISGTGTPTYAAFPTASPATGTTGNQAQIFTLNVTTSANAAFVADILQDAATSYVYSSTNGQADLYTVAPIASTPVATYGVTTRGYFQKSDAGTRNCKVQLKSGAITVQSADQALPAGSWQWIARNDLTDPATGAAWTATGVNNALIGPIVTA